ncbi:DHA1 family bicyclomycin/chloramphenicol resistance-like MFS transporter [Humitalea rosea]|uniref:Bcr/CflA family efflux transporter n=1 Tax=Humitalea rosea TaxID=990373 RepID=A0A2W7IEV4_9PROT|nr:multidrug effflux MFS transporter [Humitalea rosea]PZW45023.1 DHA1 family bicyclomycin/chloramphenicol resistance-like MFS transporter [Humitalea rosea]
MKPTPATWLLVAMTAIGPFTMQVLVPSLPRLGEQFGASNAAVQLTLTLYLAGVALGQMFYGTASDRFGRRPVLLVGLAIYLVATLAAASAQSIGGLAVARVMQAMGGCAGMVLGRAMIRDVYPRDRAASVLAYVLMAMSAAPMLAPLLGAWMDATLGWRAGMLICFGYGALVAAATWFRLPETLASPTPMAGIAGVLRAYGGLLAVPEFRWLGAVNCCTSGVFFAFMGGAPFVVVQGMGRSPQDYAYAFVGVSVAFMAGSFAAGRLSMRLGSMRMISVALAITTIGAVAGLALVLLVPGSLWLFFAPMAVVGFGNGMGQPNTIAAAVSVRPTFAGTASGLIGALQMGFGAAMTALVGVIEGGAGIGTMAVMAACGVGGNLALRGVRRVTV